MPLFERTVDKIVTDNGKVIEALQNRIAEFEDENKALSDALDFERDYSKSKIAELEKEQLPNEHGTNRYGVDVGYFRKTINRELNRDLSNFKRDELARVLARLSVTADKQVIHEDEFSEAHNLEQQAKGVEGFVKFCKQESSLRSFDKLQIQALAIAFKQAPKEKGK
jgi:hypothetical protein